MNSTNSEQKLLIGFVNHTKKINLDKKRKEINKIYARLTKQFWNK
jgi:hypothetical protein